MRIFFDIAANVPKVVATALQLASSDNLMIFSGSKYIGFGENELPAVCSTLDQLAK